MRVLHVVPTYFPAVRYGGPIYSVHGLCKALVELGHDIHVFTTNVDGNKNSDVPLGEPVDLDGVKVWYFPSRWLRRLYWSPAMKRELIRQVGSFDLVHNHSVFLWPTWAAASVSRLRGVPYVVSPRGMLVKSLLRRKSRWIKSAWIRLIEKRNLQFAAAVHVTAGAEASELQAFAWDLRRIVTIPNGVDQPLAVDRAETGVDVSEVATLRPYALFLGRINWKKGLDRLLQSWQGRDQVLVIAGNDEENYLQELKPLLDDNVRILARNVSGSDKETLFLNAALFILPSYSENFGNTVLEAMIRGIPVMVTEEVGAAEIVRESRGGWVVSGDDLSDSLDHVLADRGALATAGINGRKWAEAHGSWSGVAASMVRVYAELL